MSICSTPTVARRLSDLVRRRAGWVFPLLRFAGVGTLATGVQLGLYAAFVLWMDPQWSNVLSWGLSTVLAAGLQRSITFRVSGAATVWRDLFFGVGTSLIALILSAWAIDEFSEAGTSASLALLLAVNVVVGTGRFLALRWWFGAASRFRLPRRLSPRRP
jgi:putative flippase GtrA